MTRQLKLENAMNIKAVAQFAGVSEHTIRAWEKRYQVVSPGRASSGHRSYSFEEAEKLQLLAELVNRGHAISSIASLPMAKLKKLQSAPRAQVHSRHLPSNTELTSRSLHHSVTALIEALRNFDLEGMNQQIARAKLRYDVRTFVFQIAMPVMIEVGKLVQTAQLSIAQEHALSAMLRDHLGQTLQIMNAGNAGGPRIALATPAGDMHEFGILLSAILAADLGWSIHYLGANLPAIELAQASNRMECQVVLIGTAPIPESELKQSWSDYLTDVCQLLARPIQVWVGGAAARPGFRPKVRTTTKIEWLVALEELDQSLTKTSEGLLK